MTKVRNRLCGVMVLGLLMFLWLSASAHMEAVDVTETIDSTFDSICKPGLFYSPVRGMLLIVADMGGGRSGGQIWKFTEQRWGELIPCDKIYQSTCFAADQGYWCRVIKRDGYISLGSAKWIVGSGIFAALGLLCTLLKTLGRDRLAKEIEDA